MVELLAKLRELDEITLVELLGLKSDDLVDAFKDLIEDNENKIRRHLSENE